MCFPAWKISTGFSTFKDGKLNPQLVRPSPPSFGPGFVSEYQSYSMFTNHMMAGSVNSKLWHLLQMTLSDVSMRSGWERHSSSYRCSSASWRTKFLLTARPRNLFQRSRERPKRLAEPLLKRMPPSSASSLSSRGPSRSSWSR